MQLAHPRPIVLRLPDQHFDGKGRIDAIDRLQGFVAEGEAAVEAGQVSEFDGGGPGSLVHECNELLPAVERGFRGVDQHLTGFLDLRELAGAL